MKLLACVLFLGLASSGQGWDKLHYRYEVQVATGSPESAQLNSGLRLTANLSIGLSIRSSLLYEARMSDISVQKMDKFLVDRTPDFFMQKRLTLLDGIEAQIDKVMISKLRLPFKFTWIHGKVTSFSADSSDIPFSINVKRGILYLLQVNMDKLFSTDVEDNLRDDLPGQREPYWVLEDSPVGKCDTTYTPMLAPESISPSNFYLMKVKNYTSCYYTPSMIYSFDNLLARNNESTEHLNQQGQVLYSIKGNSEDFTIETAIGQSKQIVTPFSRKDGSIQVSINQTLYRITDVQPLGPLPRMPKAYRSLDLTQSLPSQINEDLRPYVLNPKPHIKYNPWSRDKMLQILSYIANGTIEYPSDDLPIMTQTMMEMVRQSGKFRLKEVYYWIKTNHTEMPASPTKMKVFWNLMSYAGTTDAALTQLDACLELESGAEPIDYPECTSAVIAIGLLCPPSEKVVKKLIQLIGSTWEREQREAPEDQMMNAEGENPWRTELSQVATFALGSILGRAEQMKINLETVGRRQIEMLERMQRKEIGQNVRSQLENDKRKLMEGMSTMRNGHIALVLDVHNKMSKWRRDETDDMVLLKMIRNAHHPSFLVTVARYLKPSQPSQVLRIAAAQALETFVEAKETALYFLEDIVKNPNDIAAVRIQCFRSMVNLKAPVHTLVRLATVIAFEEEKQLSTYVWSVFNQLANSTFRPYRDSAADFRDAMALIQPVDKGFQDSQYRSLLVNLADEVSGLVESSIVTTPEFRTTADIATSLDIFGTASKLFQVTLTSQGLHEVVRRMVGPNGFLTNRNSIFDLFKRPKRATDVQHLIDEIFKKLNITLREVPEAKAFVDLQWMNRVVRLYDLNEFVNGLTNVKPFILAEIDEDKWKGGVSFKYNSTGIESQFFLELPTDAGLPISLQMGVTQSLKLRGKVSGGIEPSIYKDKREGKPPVLIHGSLELEPEVLAAVTGKVSVDGYLFETGNWFEAQIGYKARTSINVSYDMPKKRLQARLAPSVSSEVPVLKLEIKPYVFSRALPCDIPEVDLTDNHAAKLETDQRPLFYTLQPVMAGLGTQLKQINYKWGQGQHGYQLTVQGQYPYRALPSSPAAPLSGRSHVAVYFESNEQYPPALSLDFMYKSRSRFGKKVCDSWFFFECYGSGEGSSDVKPTRLPEEIPQGKVSGIPDLDSPISFEALKQDILDTSGQEVQSARAKDEWDFVAVLNGSSSLVIKGLLQSWNEGQYHRSTIKFRDYSFTDGSIVWKADWVTSAVYPSKVYRVHDLLDPVNQRVIHDQVLKNVQYKEHKIINRYFERMLVTLVNDYAVRNLPSMDPQIMLDRVFPEFVLERKTPNIIRVRRILMSLMPLTDNILQLSSELENAFRITVKEDLIKDLLVEIDIKQTMIENLLKKLQGQSNILREVIASAEYTVLKITQCVLHFQKLVQRAATLRMVTNPKALLEDLNQVIQKQQDIYKLCIVVFVTKTSPAADEQTVTVTDVNPGAPVGYGRFSGPVSDVRESISDSDMIPNLQALTAHQLHTISELYNQSAHAQSPSHESVVQLIQNAASNISMINNAIQQQSVSNNKTVTKLILQATTQHLIIVYILDFARINLGTPSPSSHGAKAIPGSITNVDRYSLKVQTRELLERQNILHDQNKTLAVCYPSLNDTEKPLLTAIQRWDRILVSVQQGHIRLPTDESPWSADINNVEEAYDTLYRVLHDLKLTSMQIAALQSMPHPCLMAKFFETLTTLQLKVSIFKRTLPAQFDGDEQRKMYKNLDEQTMDLVLSLTPLFDKYLNIPAKDQVFPQGNILISQSLMDVADISVRQNSLQDMLDKYLNRPGNVQPSVAKSILRKVYQRSKEILERLSDASQGLKSSAHTTTPLTASLVYNHLKNALEKQDLLYDRIKEQLQLFPEGSSDLLISMEADRSEVENLKESCDIFTEGTDELTITSPSPIDLNDFMDDSFESSSESQELKDMTPASERLPVIPTNVGSILEGIVILSNLSYVWHDGPVQTLRVQAYAKKSVEQLMWESTQYYSKNRDRCVSKAVEDAITGRQGLEKSCMDTCLHLNAYNHLHIHAQVNGAGSNMSEWMKVNSKKLMQKLMYKYWDKTDLYEPEPYINGDNMQAFLDFSHLLDSVNQYYLTSERSMAIRSVPVPELFAAVYPFQNDRSVPKLAKQTLSNGLYPATCSLQYNNLKTTDGDWYQFPLTQHPVLLVADCSPEKSFVVLVQNIRHEEELGQKLIVLGQKHELSLKSNYISIDVNVDGSEVVVDVGKPKVYTVTLPSGVTAVALVLYRELNGEIRAEYPLLGIDVRFNIQQLSVLTSPVFSNQLCGVCGNFDGQITKEREGPQERIFYDPREFVKSYTLWPMRRQ